LLVDDARDPDPEVEAQAEEPRLEQHVPAEELSVAPVDAAQDPGVGELVLADEPARGFPGPGPLGRPRPLLTDDRRAGVDVPVPLDRLGAVLRGPGRVVVDWEASQLVECRGLVDVAEEPLAQLLGVPQRVADEPEHRRPEADEQGPALSVATLVLVDGLGPDPQPDAQAYRPERRRVQVRAAHPSLAHGFRDRHRSSQSRLNTATT